MAVMNFSLCHESRSVGDDGLKKAEGNTEERQRISSVQFVLEMIFRLSDGIAVSLNYRIESLPSWSGCSAAA